MHLARKQQVDKHFSENWIITIHMGYVVDLAEQWSRYKAARKALDNILTTDNITSAAKQNLQWFREAKAELAAFLTEGVLNEQFVLLNMAPLMECMRKANVTLRWRMLHRRCEHPKFRAYIESQIDAREVIDLLLTSAQLEFKVKAIVGDLLDSKAAKWEECRALCTGRLRELSEYVGAHIHTHTRTHTQTHTNTHTHVHAQDITLKYTNILHARVRIARYFTGEKALTRVKKDERMQKWFASLAAEVDNMSDGSDQHSTVLGRKIQKTISALEEVEQFDQIDTDMQIKQFLEDTRELLRQMIRVVNVRAQDLTRMEVKRSICVYFCSFVVAVVYRLPRTQRSHEQLLVPLGLLCMCHEKKNVGAAVLSFPANGQVVTDLSYGFELLNDYTGIIHERVRAEPSYSVLLRAGFVKLSSILDVPLTRLNEIENNADVVSVAQFYSTELVDLMRRVLDIIPRSVFEILQKIIAVQTSHLKPLPVKFESQYLKEYAQLDERCAPNSRIASCARA